MKTVVWSLLVSAGLLGALAAPLRATPPQPRRGKVLILKKNEFTIEGDIEQVGNRYRVRRGAGETWVPAERVLCLTATREEAYAYLRNRTNLDDPDERLHLAHWCRASGLNRQALAELKAAAELRPDHALTRRLLQAWQQLDPQPPAGKSSTIAVQDTGPLTPIDVTMESLGTFVTRVQPILTNTCARCHATGHGGKFRLEQVYDNNLSNRRTLERNLAAVLAQVNLQQPELSRLLTKAVADHAHSGRPPLRDRQCRPYRTLENWVKMTVADNPQLLEALPSAAPQAPAPPPETKEPRRSSNAVSSDWGAEARPAAARSSQAQRGPDMVHPSKPPIDDPYDPELFNRKMHPQTSKSEPVNERRAPER